MMNELIRYVVALTFASSVGIIAVLLVRRPVRLMFGAITSYLAWLLVPAAMAAALLPHASPGRCAWAIVLEIDPTFGQSQMLAPHSSAVTGTSVAQTACALGVWVVGAVFFGLYLRGLQRAFVRSLGKLSGARCVWRAERSAGCPVLLGVFSPTLILPADFDPSRSLRRVAQLRERDAEGSVGRRGAARGGLRGRRRSRPAGRPPSPLPFQVFASRKAWSCDLLKLPTCVATGCPSLKIIRVGMPRTA